MEKMISLSRKNFDFNFQRYKKGLFLKSNRCRKCNKEMLIIQYSTLDHIIPVKIAHSLTWNKDNLQLICKECDSNKLSIDKTIIFEMIRKKYFSVGTNQHVLYKSEKECIEYYINKYKEYNDIKFHKK